QKVKKLSTSSIFILFIFLGKAMEFHSSRVWEKSISQTYKLFFRVDSKRKFSKISSIFYNAPLFS
ncbi:hypothetical protein, partial [Enterobacter cloacae complex sp. CH23B]|uniref:hypothetical protein n=1 Tax=Enterobacter cloacae complex sp. CH23B TaxID=2511986 RepID=UPI001CA504AD